MEKEPAQSQIQGLSIPRANAGLHVRLVIDDKELAVATNAQDGLAQLGIVVDAVHMVSELTNNFLKPPERGFH